jgi:hypothetical protein
MRKRRELERVGWREWVALPDLGIPEIKAKVDTGARSSALHAFDIRAFRRAGVDRVRFRVHPVQRNTAVTVEAEAEVVDERWIRSSHGHGTLRPVIRTEVVWGQERWPIELTLIGRDEMGFRMLLGRQAVRNRFLVDPGRSFLGRKKIAAAGKSRSGRRSHSSKGSP